MRLLIAFALLSLSLCRAENFPSNTGGILQGKWVSMDGLVLIFNQTNNTLNATLINHYIQEYNVTGDITKDNTFYLYGTVNTTAIAIAGNITKIRKYYLYGAVNTTAIAITGQLITFNQSKILTILLMKYDYANCTNYTPAKTSFHELLPSKIIPTSTTTKASYNWFNYLAFENFKQEDANCSLEGTWYNDLGSSMVVKQNQDGLLEGEYYTDVGDGFKAMLYGTISPYSVFSFGLVWNGGTKISVFVGQCFPSANNVILKTQWTQLVFLKTFYNGMNNFYKEKPFARIWSSEDGLGIEFKGPKNALIAEVVIPYGRQYSVKGAMTKYNTFYLYGAIKSTAIGITGHFFRTRQGQILEITLIKYDCANYTEYTPAKMYTFELKPNETISYKTEPQIYHDGYAVAPICNLNGTWYSDRGSSMDIRQNENGSLEGRVNFPKKHSNGSSGSVKVDILGTISYSVFSFAGAWEEGKSTHVYSGQCIPTAEDGMVLKVHLSMVENQRSVCTISDAFKFGIYTFHKGV